jgi:glutamyl-tRNA(Gln) amidotransferase subunit E
LQTIANSGLKVGIEVHCQLDTKAKLFCGCPTRLSIEKPERTFLRRLRPTQSELGQVDPAAMFEFQRGRMVAYEADSDTSCLVEMDEEPPHNLNDEAVDSVLMIGLMINLKPVDEIHVMRKVVIDGSNTTGFQRTAAIGLDGYLDIPNKRVPIQHVSLEEDAARKTGEVGMTVNYRIDRLGIPLVEVATGPVINSPQEAQETALAIGRLLKATRKVKRGLGTIRQDLNISTPQGALIEIKGVQKLDLISRAVELEFQRQNELIKIKDELANRGLREDDIKENLVNVTDAFSKTASKVVKSALAKNGIVCAVKLPRFSGLLGRELLPGLRLGTEMSRRAIFAGKVGGIFHSDELPGYGITQEELERIRLRLEVASDDGFVLVADEVEKTNDALKAVVERAKEALKGVPEETRASNPDGTTFYMRPRPGAARMYPETDVPPISITSERISRIKASLPPLPETVMKRLTESFGLNEKLAKQLLDSDFIELFETVATRTKIQPSFIATILTETLKSLDRDGVALENLVPEHIEKIFYLVDKGETAKESVEKIARWMAENPGKTPDEAMEKLSLGMLSEQELASIVDKVVFDNISLLKDQGDRAAGKLLGLVMVQVRGRADAKRVAALVKERARSTT